MCEFICVKACTLGEVGYTPGDEIPAGAVLPERERALTKQGYIAVRNGVDAEAFEQAAEYVAQLGTVLFAVPVLKDGNAEELLVDEETLKLAAYTVQLTAEDAVKALPEVANENALVLIGALDSRKTVKKAVEERLAERRQPPENGAGGAGKSPPPEEP